MSTVALESSEAEPMHNGLINASILAFCDQLLISGTNFITMVLMARGLASPAAFGVFVLVYSILLFANSLQSALITQPHNVLGTTRSGRDYVIYTSSTAISQIVFVLISAAAVLIAWVVARFAGWHSANILLAMSGTIVAWQLQEFTRRVLYTENRIGSAVIVDTIAYAGQALAITTLWWGGRLTGVSALLAITATSTAATILGIWYLRGSIAPTFEPSAIKGNWHFGKWLAGGYIVGNWLSSQLLIFLAAGILGTWAAGVLRMAHTTFGPMRILAQALSTTLPTKLAITLDRSGVAGYRRAIKQTFLFVIPTFAVYCTLVGAFSKSFLLLVFGEAYVEYDFLLKVYAVSAFVGYMCIVFSASLRATQRTREIFLCELCSTLVVVPLSAALLPIVGIYGVIVGMILTDMLLFGLIYLAYRATLRDLARSDLPGPVDLHVGEVAAQTPEQDESQSHNFDAACRGEMLSKVLSALDRNAIAYCILHGYERYPQYVLSDVDCVVDPEPLSYDKVGRRWKAVFKEIIRHEMTIVQWISGGAHGIVLRQHNGEHHSVFLQLDLSDGVNLNKRIPFYSGQEVLKDRKRFNNFHVPNCEIEFGCSLIRRIVKQRVSAAHASRLGELYLSNPLGCHEQLLRLFPKVSQDRIINAADSRDWHAVESILPQLKRQMLVRAILRNPVRVGRNFIAGACRRALRWLNPTGFHLVLLGPDGAGKSSVAAGVRKALAPVFLESACRSFPPRVLDRDVGDPSAPHNIRPRSQVSSVIRAVLYWWVYYCPGYFLTVYPALVRSSLVVHDRHLVDCEVDAVRYRYSGPKWLLQSIWRSIPKPHLVVLLDVPAETLQARKQEVPFEVSRQQRQAYLELVQSMPNSLVIDGSQSLEVVVAEICDAILGMMAERCHDRLGLRDQI
jgi:O-antigen/teichoic acid export membrane protein/thymidylate kinase